jgi:hypothetical protein
MYASFLRISRALHLHIFQQPLNFQYSGTLSSESLIQIWHFSAIFGLAFIKGSYATRCVNPPEADKSAGFLVRRKAERKLREKSQPGSAGWLFL